MRPGWGILCGYALFLVLGNSAAAIFLRYVRWYNFPRTPHLRTPLEYAPQFIALAAFFLALFIVSLLEQRKVATYGYAGRRKKLLFAVGLASGFGLMAALMLIMWAAGLVTISGRQLFGWQIFRFGAEHALGFLCVAVLEQSGMRGYLQYSLTRGLTFLYKRIFGFESSFTWAFWTSALLCAGLFVSYYSHTIGETALGLLSAGLLGMLAAWSLWRTGNLWWAIGFNFAYLFTEAFIFGAPAAGWALRQRLVASVPPGSTLMTGGQLGPEGTPLFLIFITLAAIIVTLLPQAEIYPGIPKPRRQHFPMMPDPDARHTVS